MKSEKVKYVSITLIGVLDAQPVPEGGFSITAGGFLKISVPVPGLRRSCADP